MLKIKYIFFKNNVQRQHTDHPTCHKQTKRKKKVSENSIFSLKDTNSFPSPSLLSSPIY